MTRGAVASNLATMRSPISLSAPVFATTVALSAALLFAVQPMLGKALLPAFGGGAAVWTAVMLFFQAGLLGGSGLFHLAATRIGLRAAALLQLGLAALALVVLPGVPAPRATGIGPTADVLATLAAGYGPAVLVLGANAAALQAWYARLAGDQPWWLYAVSNAGSLLGLLAYPLLLEPNLALSTQGAAWGWGFALLGLGLMGCALPLVLAGRAVEPGRAAAALPGPRPALAWIGLAALPSSLLLGVTEHVTVTVAPLPLLWVLPLAAYLLSWIVAFWRPAGAAVAGQALLTLLVLPLLAEAAAPLVSNWSQAAGIAVHVGAILAAGLLAHGRLALRRPDPSALTGFYLCISLGGVLGGLANAVVAPALLDRTLEYPLALAVLFLLPGFGRPVAAKVLWGLLAALMLAAPVFATLTGQGPLAHGRDFYGAVRVVDDADHRVLLHGRTVHGTQWRDPARALEPTSYYHREAGAGRAIALLQDGRDPAAPPLRGALVGLGAGTMACYGGPGLRLSFIEISAAVVEAARGWFSFLRECGDPPVEVADGRIALAARPPGSLDLIVLDAYAGASVPAHLATVEAVEMFLSRLAPGGLLLFHVSHRSFDLAPQVAASAREAGAGARVIIRRPETTASIWVAVTREAALLARLDAAGWEAPSPAPRAWRDDRWDLVSALRRPW